MASRKKERPQKYVAAIHSARRQLAEARLGLAKTTKPGGPVSYVEPKWRWAQQLVDDRTPALLRHPQVVGLGLGAKITDGIDTGKICVTVFVTRKLKETALGKRDGPKLPKVLRRGKRTLPVDVVQIGRLKRQAFAGGSCSVTNGLTRTATIGAPAVTPAGGQVFITAMHVTGVSEIDSTSGVTLPVRAPSAANLPSAPVIGQVIQGSRNGIDAAKVRLTHPHVVTRVIPGIGSIRGWRPPVFPADRNIPVAAFGSVSLKLHKGFIVNPAAFVPGFGLDSAITVRGLETVEGDSGCALVDGDRIVLGFLVGVAADGLRVFSPASLVLKRLGCDIPTVHT